MEQQIIATWAQVFATLVVGQALDRQGDVLAELLRRTA